MYFSAALVAAFAGYAQAQSITVQAVQVGSTNGSVSFYPEKITAPVGSMVQFQFMGGNHTVTQSNFDNPCVPLGESDPSAVGIFSGHVPVDASADQGQRPVFSILINDTTPMWLYCQTGPHCANGMAMVINENTEANSTRSLENYKASASALQPDDQQPGGGDNNNAGGEDNNNNGGGDNNNDEVGPPGFNNPGSDGAEEGDDAPAPAAGSSLAVPSTLLLAVAAAFILI